MASSEGQCYTAWLYDCTTNGNFFFSIFLTWWIKVSKDWGRDILETERSGQKKCLKKQEFVCVFHVSVTGFPVI